jgi:hypothetical protein
MRGTTTVAHTTDSAYGNLRNPITFLARSDTSVNSYVSELPIGEILVKAGLVSQVQVDEVVRDSGTRQRLIGKTLVARGWLKPEQLKAALQAQSLLRDGIVDSFKALKALSIACTFNKSFEEALYEVTPQAVAAASMTSATCKLGELLVSAAVIDTATLEDAHRRSEERGEPLGVVLVADGILSESYLDAALELQVRVRDGMFSREQAIAALKQDPRRLLDMIAPNMKADEGLKIQTKAAIRLGEFLLRAGIVSQADVMQALELSLAHGHPIGEMFVARGFVTRALLDAALSLQRMITMAHLSIGDATACLVKVFTTDKAVSECLLELNFLKFKKGDSAARASLPLPGKTDNRATMAQLPALNFGARSTSGDTESGDTKSGDTKSGDTASGAITVAVTSAENCEPESEPSEMIATVLDNIGQYQGDLPIPETTPVNYEDYFAANFTYVAADRGAFYESLRASYSRLGRVLLKRKELIESEDLLREALDISTTEKFAVKQPEDLMFLACLYLKQGKSWQSEKLLRQSLIILENTPDVSDRLIGLCHHRLALVYCHLSLLFKAERHFKKAVQMLTDSDKASLNRLTQRRLAAVLKDYAVLLNRMRRESEADQYYAQARKVLSSSILTG